MTGAAPSAGTRVEDGARALARAIWWAFGDQRAGILSESDLDQPAALIRAAIASVEKERDAARQTTRLTLESGQREIARLERDFVSARYFLREILAIAAIRKDLGERLGPPPHPLWTAVGAKARAALGEGAPPAAPPEPKKCGKNINCGCGDPNHVDCGDPACRTCYPKHSPAPASTEAPSAYRDVLRVERALGHKPLAADPPQPEPTDESDYGANDDEHSPGCYDRMRVQAGLPPLNPPKSAPEPSPKMEHALDLLEKHLDRFPIEQQERILKPEPSWVDRAAEEIEAYSFRADQAVHASIAAGIIRKHAPSHADPRCAFCGQSVYVGVSLNSKLSCGHVPPPSATPSPADPRADGDAEKALAWADAEITTTRASEKRMLGRLEEAERKLAEVTRERDAVEAKCGEALAAAVRDTWVKAIRAQCRLCADGSLGGTENQAIPRPGFAGEWIHRYRGGSHPNGFVWCDARFLHAARAQEGA